eukprot:3071015-Pyramimonas_sp.AAC.1
MQVLGRHREGFETALKAVSASSGAGEGGVGSDPSLGEMCLFLTTHAVSAQVPPKRALILFTPQRDRSRMWLYSLSEGLMSSKGPEQYVAVFSQ